MEKLIELLQEYLNSEVFKKDVSGNDNIEDIPDVKVTRYFSDRFYYTYISDAEFEIPTDTVIGKRYGFIKWLVENDKIDYHNKINYHISLAIHWREKRTTREERLLMMLAIQDEPIKFLCSLLK